MKTRVLIYVSVLLFSVTFLLAEDVKKDISKEEFYKYWVGTWINPDLQGSDWTPQKLVCHVNGTQDRYSKLNMNVITCTHPYTQIEYWNDSEGNIWYKGTATCALSTVPVQEIGKINVSNNTYEQIYYLGTEPLEEWDPDNPKYIHRIYYRQ